MVYVVYREKFDKGEDIVASFVDFADARSFTWRKTRRHRLSGTIDDRYYKICEFNFALDNPWERDKPKNIWFCTLTGFEHVG